MIIKYDPDFTPNAGTVSSITWNNPQLLVERVVQRAPEVLPAAGVGLSCW